MKTRTRLSILSLSLAAATWTGLATAGTVTITDIVTQDKDSFVLTVPTLEAVDASLDEAALRRIFSSDFAGIADQLGDLDAAAIRIPEIDLDYKVVGPSGDMVPAKAVYRDVELLDVTDGIAKSASMSAVEISGGETGAGLVTLGAMSTQQFDLGAILGFYGLSDEHSGDMRQVYENFVLDGGRIASVAGNCDIGSATAAYFKARPIKGSFADLMRLSTELEAAEGSDTPPSPETVAKVIAFYADLLTAFESAPTKFEGFTCDFVNPDGKRFALAAGPGEIGGFEPGIYPALSLDDFSAEATDGWLRFDNFTWKRMDLNDAIENLVEVGASIDEKWIEENWRVLIPAIEGLSLSGLAFDLPDPETPNARVQASVGSFDISLSDYVNGIPTSISTGATDVDFGVPAGEQGAALRALGIERLSLGYQLTARWNRDARTITIDELSLSGGDNLGGIKISGTLANAGPELFSERNEVALAAAMAVTATDLRIEIENAGALAMIITAAAAEEKQQPQALHVAMTGMARALPLAILGGTPEAMKLSEALGAFMAGTPKLTLTLTSTDPKGIGLAELMAAEDDPAVLKDKVAVAADVSGEPVPFTWPEPEPERPAPPAPPDNPAGADKADGKN